MEKKTWAEPKIIEVSEVMEAAGPGGGSAP